MKFLAQDSQSFLFPLLRNNAIEGKKMIFYKVKDNADFAPVCLPKEWLIFFVILSIFAFYDNGMNALPLIPQRPPFVFVDDIMNMSATGLDSVYTVTESCPLLRDDALTESGILEHVAQSMAAYIGWSNEGPVKIGVVASASNIVFNGLPKVGETLHTHIEIVNKVFEISQIFATVRCGSELLAEGEMKLVESIE